MPRAKRRGSIWLALLVTAALAMPAPAAELATADRYPLRGETTTITVTDDGGSPMAGLEIEALYRPNSVTARTETIATTGPDGSVSWTPRDAGIVALTARRGDEQVALQNIAVRFGSFPASGIAILLLAGILLFGGAAYGFRALLRD